MGEFRINNVTSVSKSGSEIVIIQERSDDIVSVHLGLDDFEKVMQAVSALVTSDVTNSTPQG